MNRFSRYIFVLCAALTAPLAGQAAANELDDDSLGLAECQQMALEHNRHLQNARIEVQKAAEDKAAAFTHYFPTVSVSATGFIGAKDLMRSTIDLTSLGETLAPILMQFGMADMLATMPSEKDLSMIKKGFMANAMVMQPLFSGGQIVMGNRLAALQNEVRRLQVSLDTKELLRSVADYYWQIVTLRSSLVTLNAVDDQLRAIHRLTGEYVKAGVTNRNDLLTVELKQQEMASARLQLNNALDILTLVLAQLCGADFDTFRVASPAALTQPEVPDAYFVSPAEAVLEREELALAARNVDICDTQVKMERAKQMPTLAVGAAYLLQGVDMGGESQKRGGTVADMNVGNLVGLATLSIPVTDWWAGHHNVRKARLARQQAENDRLDAQEKLQIGILTSWHNLTEAYAQIEIARRSITAASENLRLCRDQYAAGTLPISDLLDAVTLFTRASSDEQQALATYQNRLSDYLRQTR